MIFFFLAACTMTTECSRHRQMVLPASSANVRNYNNPAGMKRGDRAEYSGDSKLVAALHPQLWLLITVVTCGWAHLHHTTFLLLFLHSTHHQPENLLVHLKLLLCPSTFKVASVSLSVIFTGMVSAKVLLEGQRWSSKAAGKMVGLGAPVPLWHWGLLPFK